MRSRLRALPYVLLLLPFDLLVALSLWVAVLFCFRRNKATEKQRRPDTEKATIIIVSWNGKHLLEQCLPSVVEATRSNDDILVVDNGSTDGSVEFIRERFPQIRILPLDRNYGYSEGNNRGVADAHTDIVVLLNNDMIVDRAFLKPLLDGFSDASVFAVTSQIFFADAQRRREETGKTRARFENGFFYLWHDDIRPDDEMRGTMPVFWAGGGSCAIDRKKYLELGGFDALYQPFYLEDTDLSYQAWKRGWQSLLAPGSRVIHKHRSSTAKFGNDFVENTIRKNQLLFVWKTVTDFSMLLEHTLNLPKIHARAIFHQSPGFEIRAFFRALRQLPQALRSRIHNASYSVLSDREVLARSRKS